MALTKLDLKHVMHKLGLSHLLQIVNALFAIDIQGTFKNGMRFITQLALNLNGLADAD